MPFYKAVVTLPFRGYLTLNGGELSNSSRVIEHLRGVVPTMDAGFWGSPTSSDCAIEMAPKVYRFDEGLSPWLSPTPSQVTWDDDNGEGGGGCIAVAANGAANTALLNFDAAAGDLVTVTGRVGYAGVTATAGADRIHMSLTFFDDVDTALSTVVLDGVSSPTGTVTWSDLAGSATAPTDTVRAALSVGTTAAVTAGTVYFDTIGVLAPSLPSGLGVIPPDAVELRPGLYAPPPGSRLYGRALFEVDGTCWEPRNFCGVAECLQLTDYDDTWPGLMEWMNDAIEYRVELAPWFSTRIPESGEFAGMWVMDIKGLDATPVERSITQAVGNGGIASPHRDLPRELEFDALLIACTNAGLEYGLEWLSCQLRSTKDRSDSVLRFFNAHPSHTAAHPDEMLRETHGVIYTGAPEVTEKFAPRGKDHQQATMYRVTWKMGVTSPYVYLPSVSTPVDWETITTKRVNWLHAADCEQPYTCVDMPVMFSTECVPEEIGVIATPPPSCGGCMPVCTMLQHSWVLPSRDHPYRCRETAVGLEITNNSESSLSLQAFWRVCGSDVRCENSLWPLQVAGLPPATSLTVDAITGRYWSNYDGKRWRTRGIVGTPTGAPWRPIVLDRATCWELVVVTSDQVDFDVTVTMVDREP